jgi:integrase
MVAEEISGTVHCNLGMSRRYAPPQRHQKGIEMQQKLTDVALRALKAPAESRIEISDTERVRLRFRLTSSNKATWLYQKQIKGGIRRRFTLGTYPAMSLAQARAEALAIQLEAESGIDRVATQEALRAAAAAEALTARTVKDVLDLYIVNHIEQELKPGQAREERKRQLLRYLGPHFTRRIDDVSRADIQKIIGTKQAEGKVVMANRPRAAIAAFTLWAYNRGHCVEDASSAVQKAGKETARTRTPSLEEVREIWAATFELGNLSGPFFRLCILTGQRSRSDILAMKWAWVDFEKSRYEIPNPKNGRAHIVHLCDAALAELESLKKLQLACAADISKTGLEKLVDNDFVFSTTGRTAASGVSKAKARLDPELHVQRKKNGDARPFEPWVLHDLRRSQATALAEAGFDEGVVDRIQNHVAGGSRASAVAAVYNKAQKLPERARALNAWGEMVLGRWGDVVSVRGVA